MKVDVLHGVVILSRRNLKTLLAKLDGHPPNSACVIYNGCWAVMAEEDSIHYQGRTPGQMDPETEEVIK